MIQKLWLFLMDWCRRQYDKTQEGPFLSLLNTGPFYVRYPDGRRSIWLDYRSAKSMAAAHGGRIWHTTQAESDRATGAGL